MKELFEGLAERIVGGRSVWFSAKKLLMAMAAMLTFGATGGGVTATAVTAQQRYPWDGKVDIVVSFLGASNDVARVECTFAATNTATQTELPVVSITCDDVASGGADTWTRHFVWDSAADVGQVQIDDLVFVVKLVEWPLYCVIDLSAGSSATSYPMSYLHSLPSGGWTEEYKTTKLVLRRIAPGSIGTAFTLTKPYYIGVFEVTQKQYELIMETNPPEYRGELRPVGSVSYNMIRGSSEGSKWPASNAVDADSFLGKLRTKTGFDFDLPTEAQWIYACRAGTSGTYNNGGSSEGDLMLLGRYAGNCNDGKGGYTDGCTAVGSYLPNAWGIYDMHGNIFEWCLDWDGNSVVGTDPVGASSGSRRRRHGGSYSWGADSCTWSYYYKTAPDKDYGECGIRLARTLQGFVVSSTATTRLVLGPPRVCICIDEVTKCDVSADGFYKDYKAKLEVSIMNDPPDRTKPVVVELGAMVSGDGELDSLPKLYAQKYIRISKTEGFPPIDDNSGMTTQVIIPVGKSSVDCYIYVLGAKNSTEKSGIVFTPKIIDGPTDISLADMSSAVLYVHRQGNGGIGIENASPDAIWGKPGKISMEKTDELSVTVWFNDTYRNALIDENYTFYLISAGYYGEGTLAEVNDVKYSLANPTGCCKFSLALNRSVRPGGYGAELYGVSADGSSTARIPFELMVLEPKSTDIGPVDYGYIIGEGETIQVKLGLNREVDSMKYIFIKGATDGDEALFESSLKTQGAQLGSDNKRVDGTKSVKFLDGDTTVRINAVLCDMIGDPTAETIGWNKGGFSLIVTNKPPVVKSLRIAGMPVTSGTTTTGCSKARCRWALTSSSRLQRSMKSRRTASTWVPCG